MMKAEILEIGAVAAKTAIDKSGLKPDSKEWIKLVIDGAKEFLKAYSPPKRLDVDTLGMERRWMNDIQREAAACGLTCVRVIPWIMNGQREYLFFMNGGKLDAFCEKTGIYRLEGLISGQEREALAQLLQMHGLILYEKV